MSNTDRIVALIDMDCFYCQVEEKLDPNLAGKPIAVVQYNQWKGGGIIAVNYLARDQGVTRQMRGDEAKEKCPEIQLPRVPQVRGKADLTKYREAGKQVAEVLKSFTNVLERASIDEAYLDLTEAVNTELKNGMPIISREDLSNTYVVGCETSDFLSNIYQNSNSGLCDDDLKLAVGGVIVERIRAAVFRETGFKCSAGIAHNKTLAKLVCSLHKPNKQTILPQQAVREMFATLPIRKIKSLGGKFGHILSETLKINYIGELVKFSEKELIQTFDDKTGKWLYNISRGIDKEPVQIKLISKSIGCCKRFPGRTSLCKLEEIEHWMKELSCEISERLEEDLKENNRRGKLMTVSFAQETKQTEVSSTRAISLKSYEVDKICQSALEVLKKNCQKSDGTFHVTFLGLSIGNFENIKNVRSITSYFGKVDKEESVSKSILEKKGDSRKGNIMSFLQNNKCKESENPTKNESNKPINYLTKNLMKEIECTFEEGNPDNSSVKDETSIYSESTISLEENPEELIFYDDGFQGTIEHRKEEDNSLPLKRSDSIGSTGSLDGEVCFDSVPNSPVLERKTPESGFFSRYFDNAQVDRNFDTSKILGENSDDESIEDENNISEFTEICRECGEMIPIIEIVSHMDYHFALKLSKEESPMKRVMEDEVAGAMSRKRKAVESRKGSIVAFLKKEESNTDVPTEICSECHKRIKLSDLNSHSDYHAAKKLHSELNNIGENRNIQKSADSSNQKIIKKNKTKTDITSFFKRNTC